MNTYGGPVTVASLIAVLAVLLAAAYAATAVAGGVQQIAQAIP